jgi:hypothetical protein
MIGTGTERIPIEAYSTTNNNSLVFSLTFEPNSDFTSTGGSIVVEGSDVVVTYTGNQTFQIFRVITRMGHFHLS